MPAPKTKSSKKNIQIAKQGIVKGFGSGISDDIKAKVPLGSYVIPADSAAQVGADQLQSMGNPVDVNLSNGEFVMPPEQVHAVGVKALDAIKNATHVPAKVQSAIELQAKGFNPAMLGDESENPKMFFADGGLVDDPLKRKKNSFDVTNTVAAQSAQPADFHVDSQGGASRIMPGRELVPYQASSTDSSATQREPDYRARAETTMARAKADTAAYEASRAAQDARFEAARAGTTAPNTAPSQPSAVARSAKGFGSLLSRSAPIAAGAAIMQGMDEDSTARYAKRFGMDEPTGDGSAGDVAKFAALRGLGFASDLGSVMTGGAADTLYQDQNKSLGQAAADVAGGGIGAYLGAKGGDGIGGFVGKGVDLAGRAISRGKYKGDYAQKLLGGTGKVVGGATGYGAGQGAAGALFSNSDNHSSNATAQSNQDQQATTDAQGATANQQATTDAGNGFSTTGINGIVGKKDGSGYSFSNMPADVGGAKGTLDMPHKGTFSAVSGGNEAMARNLRAAEIMQQNNALRGFNPQGIQVNVVKDSSRSPTRDEMLRAKLDQQQAQTELAKQQAASMRDSQGIAYDKNARDELRAGIEAKAANLSLQQQQIKNDLFERYQNTQDPNERAALGQYISSMYGKQTPLRDNYMTVKDQDGNQRIVDLRTLNNPSQRRTVSMAEVKQQAESSGISPEKVIQLLADKNVAVSG